MKQEAAVCLQSVWRGQQAGDCRLQLDTATLHGVGSVDPCNVPYATFTFSLLGLPIFTKPDTALPPDPPSLCRRPLPNGACTRPTGDHPAQGEGSFHGEVVIFVRENERTLKVTLRRPLAST